MADRTLSRRELLEAAARCGAYLGGAGVLLGCPAAMSELLAKEAAAPASPAVPEGLAAILKEAPVARYWTSTAAKGISCLDCHDPGFLDGKTKHEHEQVIVRCGLCAHGCVIPEGERGRCRARMNVKGELRTLVYGRPMSSHVDPIEKKPFYHFLPGATAFSLSTSGCPLRCKFCQNWQISQARPEDYRTPFRTPEVIVTAANRRRAPVIAYTYNEPTVFTEYLTDIARAGKKKGLRSVLISCGFMQEAPLAEMCGVLDAIKIDLKGYDEGFYRNVSSAELKPVLRSIKQVAKSGTHLEIVNLVVPTLNDSEPMLRGLSKWVVNEVGPDVPVHFTRFHPDYQLMNLPPTPVATLARAREIAMAEGVRYAFVGNVPGHPGNHTYCPSCKEPVIARRGFFVMKNDVKEGKCAHCETRIAGVWE